MSNKSYESSFSTMEYIQNILTQIFTPYIIIVCVIGIAGNVLTIIMLSKRSLTKNFNNCTLIALAVTDLLFNLSLVSHSISALSGYNSDNFCRILSFISHLAELLSACFTAHFTIQRFIAVRFPLSVFMGKNMHLVHYLIVALVILFGVSYCLELIKKNHYEYCEEQLDLKWFISDALTSFVIPFTIIATLNFLIIFRLRKISRKNQQLSFNNKRTKKEFLPLTPMPRQKYSISSDSNSQSRFSDQLKGSNTKTSIYQFSTSGETNDNFLSVDRKHRHRNSIRSTSRSHAQSHRVTRMLILVSTCFLLLNAPSHICTIGLKIYALKNSQLPNHSHQIYINPLNHTNETILENFNMSSTTILPSYRDHRIKRRINYFHIFYIIVIICHHISYLSYSINFFLYSFCGMKFRRELMKFFSKCRNYREQIPTSSGPHCM